MQNRHKNKPDKNKLIYDTFLIRDSFYKKLDKRSTTFFGELWK